MTRSTWIPCCLAALMFLAVADATTMFGRRALERGRPRRPDCRNPSIFARSSGVGGLRRAYRANGTRAPCLRFAGPSNTPLPAKQNTAVPLSVEFLNWAGNQTGKESLDGACFSELWKAVTAYGICPETEMPYQEYYESINKPSQEAIAHAGKLRDLGLRLHWIKEWDRNKGLTDQQLVEIKRTIARRWPVGGGFLWPKRRHIEWEQRRAEDVPTRPS